MPDPVNCFERKQALVLLEAIIDGAALRDLGYQDRLPQVFEGVSDRENVRIRQLTKVPRFVLLAYSATRVSISFTATSSRSWMSKQRTVCPHRPLPSGPISR
jgi:hypothetical protein